MFWKISYQTLHFESNLSLIQFRFIYAAPNHIFSISESEALTSFLFFYLYLAEQATVEPPSALLTLVQGNRGAQRWTTSYTEEAIWKG